MNPMLVIHGGLGRQEGNFEVRDPRTGAIRERSEDFHRALAAVLAAAWPILVEAGARAAVLAAIRALEDDPLFNAGLGSKLQADGRIRMSAGLMDGPGGRFSGAINVQGLRHPIDLAAALSAEPNTVLADAMATGYAREHGLAMRDPFTAERIAEHERRQRGAHGTVGAVALDAAGAMVAGTSTGGLGGETPGRVSDTPTVAGTYASARAGVSCTGRGEDITSHAAAARVVVRVEDGVPLAEAVSRSVAEADARGFEFGMIGLDAQGAVAVGQTREALVLHGVHDGARPRTFHRPVDA